MKLDGRFCEAECVDTAADGFDRLRHGRFLNLRDGGLAKRQSVAVGFAGGAGRIPIVTILLCDQVAKCGALRDVAHKDVRIVYAANFVEADGIVSQLWIEAIHHLIGFLRDGILHLNLKNQVRAALQVEAELNLMAEIVLDLRDGGWERRQPNQQIDRKQHNENNEYGFPLHDLSS